MGLNNHPHVDWLIARYDLSNMISMWRYVHDVSHWLTLGKTVEELPDQVSELNETVNRLLQFKCNRGYVQGVSYFVQEELKACALQWMLTDELQLNHARDLTLTGIGRTTPLPKDARAQVERYYATPDMAALCASYMTF